MKTEQLIVQYLYSNKTVTLQQIGAFSITAATNIPEEGEKDIVLPTDSIQFVYDPKATVDDGLVAYIMESTRKIKPLAHSDLESYIILNKQFLNIGKPFLIEGIGTLQKTQKGDYSFIQGNIIQVVNEELPKLITEKFKEKISFATPQKEKPTGESKIKWWILLGIIILGAALVIIYFLNKNEKNNTTENNNFSNTSNSTGAKNTADTFAAVTKNSPVAKAVNIKDSNNFYIVIKEFPNLAAAEKSYNRLISYGNNVAITTKDSVTYKMRMPFVKPITDTLRVKDSLSKFFQAKTYVEMP